MNGWGAASGTATTCGECLGACGVLLSGRSIEGDRAHPITQGYLCANGRAAVKLLGHPGRLQTPLVNGAPTPWPAALDRAAERIRAARASGGPDAIGLYFGAGDPAGSLAFLAASGFLQGLGSTRHYNVTGLEATHRYVAAEAMFGDALLVPRADVERAGALLVMGSNPPVSNDEGGLAAALSGLRRRGGVLVVVDPRRTELARVADVHLPILPGTDLEVLLAILHVVFAERLFRAGDARLTGREELARLALEMPPARAASVAGVDVDRIVAAARALAGAAPAAVLTRLGVAMSRRATVNEWLAVSLIGVLGGIGVPGGLVHNPGFLDVRTMLRRARVGDGSILGVLPPADLAEAILERTPRLRALVVVAADPMESLPNTARVERALRRLDALIVLDVQATSTTRLATHVFPIAHHLEKEDVSLLLPDRVPALWTKATPAAARPPGLARSEVAVLAELAARLGTPLFGARAVDLAARAATVLGGDEERPIAPRGAMRVLLPLLSRFSLTWARAAAGATGPGTGRLDGRALRGERRAVDLAPARFLAAARRALHDGPAGPPLPATDAGAPGTATPLCLSTCVRARDQINGKLRLCGRGAEGLVLHLHPEDAAARGLVDGQRAVLETRTGRARATVRVDESLRAGFVAIPFGSPGLNRLTDDTDRDPLSGIPALANVPCRVSPEEEGSA